MNGLMEGGLDLYLSTKMHVIHSYEYIPEYSSRLSRCRADG